VGLFKDIIWWKYERASWQWDVLCILIMCFIFLTPKDWFENRDNLATQTTRLIISKDDFSTDRTVLENKVKELSGNPNAVIIDSPREKKDTQGKIYYEIEIK
jgi:hypothetical protein